jgi:outer membrane protein assembly factor BamE (lipoprotein component of BamABCDE complex)
MLRKLILLSLVVALAGAGIACGGKVSKSNYDKITDGMTKAEVENILGPGEKGTSVSVGPVDVKVDSNIYRWHDGDKEITVTFKDGKVVAKTAHNL